MAFVINNDATAADIPSAAEDSINAGNSYYMQDRFGDAVRAYESVLEQGVEAPDLYYNLGNAYFKSNNITYAILNYERGLLLDPRNEDIKYNLELARNFVVDDIEEVPGFILTELHIKMLKLLSADSWALFSILSFFLLLLSISLYLYLRTYGAKKLFFWLSILLLYLTVTSFVFSYHHRKLVLEPGTALISIPSVIVESSPDDSGTDLFLLHEATKVSVKESIGEWSKIKVADGNEGWVPTRTLIFI